MKSEIHRIHNYIRDNTKISNEDKPLFIAIILIGLKNNTFSSLIEHTSNKDNIYSLLELVLHENNIDINIFRPIITSEDKSHLFNLILMVNDFYKKNPNIDLLNEFYGEFVRYNNTDSKSLGIVLTPHYIVKIMVELIRINKDDIVLDLCTGTGSFLLESSIYNPKKLIGCEYQNKLFALLNCNFIIRDIHNYQLIKGDCFETNFKCTKSIINPPYGMRDKKELDFVIKQLESLEPNGECCSIIPIGKLSNNKSNNKYKKKILSIARVKTIIICKKELFYPVASIQCCILHLVKTNADIDTSIIDFVNDGYSIQINNGMIRSDKFNEIYDKLKNAINNPSNLFKLKYNDNWMINDNNKILYIDSIFKTLKLRELEEEYNRKKKEILDLPIEINIVKEKYKEYMIIDLFDQYKIKNPLLLKKTYETGDIPLICASKFNNGVSKYIVSQQDKEIEKGNCLIYSTVGTCFYQEKDFYGTSSLQILRPKINISKKKLIQISILIMDTYIKKYNKDRGFNFDIFKKNVIYMEEL